MKRHAALLAAGLGAAVVAWLAWRTGLSALAHSILRLGPGGSVLVLAFQLGLAALAGLAWAALARGRPDSKPGRFVMARLVRDAGVQAMPFTHLAGVAMGARSLALDGVSGDFAIASTLADVTLELTSQLVYIAVGASILASTARQDVRMALAFALGLAAFAAALALASRKAPGLASRLASIAPQGWLKSLAGFFSRPTATRTHAPPAAKALACLLHLCAWLLTGVQTWIILNLLGASVTIGAGVAIDSMASGAKAVGFFVPAGLGVQEGALILFGQLFGVPPSAALALSLIRRGRDLALAAPVLLAWQLRHGDRIWRFGRS